MNFSRLVIRPSLITFLLTGTACIILVFIVSMVIGESKMNDVIALNQWLARDIASQFSGVAGRMLSRTQKFASFVRAETGTFEAGAQKEFETDSSLKAVWVLDATGAGPLQPLAHFQRDGFSVNEVQTEIVRRLVDAAVLQGAAARGVAPGLSAVALKVGDMPRTVLLFFDEAIFARANGGPWGDKWLLLAPSADRTEAVLVESTSELRDGVEFPSFDEISRSVTSETPTQERSEFTTEVVAASGGTFQVSGVQTGIFGVMAVAVTPLENSFAEISLLLKLAVGVSLSFSLLVMLLQMLRYRRIRRVDLSTDGITSQRETSNYSEPVS